jgi:hypothetical protein
MGHVPQYIIISIAVMMFEGLLISQAGGNLAAGAPQLSQPNPPASCGEFDLGCGIAQFFAPLISFVNSAFAAIKSLYNLLTFSGIPGIPLVVQIPLAGVMNGWGVWELYSALRHGA